MAKKKGVSADELRSTYEPQIKLSEMLINLQKEELAGLNSIFDVKKKLIKSQDVLNLEQGKLNQMISGYNSLTEKGERITKGKQKIFEDQFKLHLKSYKLAEKDLAIQKKKVIAAEQYAKAGLEYMGIMKKAGSDVLTYLIQSDIAIKNLNLGLGLSGDRSEAMAQNLSDAAPFAARMGVDMKGLAEMAATYADETGRARILTEESLRSMTLIAEGTNLGAEGAARMAGNYEMMGFNAVDTSKEVQRIVDTSERMGVNTGKVLKVVGANFKKLQKYSFKNGVKGMADMAIYAGKFKMDMDSIFTPLESGRHLNSVIEMSAQLQVLGGNFANLSDPMSMLFESRNDPEAYMKRINEMTKGMVTLNKTAEGFEFSMASPMAQDQLAQAAKALGMTTDELTQQAFRMAEIQKTRSQMFSKGFSSSEKEVIEGLAKFDSKSGKMIVDIGGTAKEIANLTTQDMLALEKQRSSLEQRAMAAQGFDEAFQNTIMELKATFLPLLKTMNSVFSGVREAITPLLNALDSGDALTKGLILGGAAIGIGAAKLLFAFTKGKALGFLDAKGLSGMAARSNMTKGSDIGKNVGKGAKGAGKGMLRGGAGIGAAALGVGAGIGIAAVGIGKLADSMSKLTPEQAKSLESIVSSIAWMTGIAVAAAAAIAIFGVASTAASLGLLAFGGAILMVGAGIGIAAAGIGYMGEGLSKMDGVDLSGMATGMLSIGAAGLMIGNPMGIIGMAAMTASVMAIGANADNMERVGNAFANIGAVMSGSAGDMSGIKDTINSISSMDVGDMGISSLVDVLSKPLMVQFADQEIGMVAHVDVTMDGDRLTKTITQRVPVFTKDLQQAKAGA